MNFQNSYIQYPQMQYQCSPYTYNPYVCAYAPVSQVVMPQGQVKMPSAINQPPQIQVVPQPYPYNPNVNYNQITPYLNTGASVFQPSITTKSGQVINTAPVISSKPFNQQESTVVYSGPVKKINPQITPVEQSDNEINNQMNDYFRLKAENNPELKKALFHTTNYKENKTPWYKTALTLLGIAAVIGIGYRFRYKIPILNKFIKFLES